MTGTATMKIVAFKLGGELFAADIFAVERVLRYQPPTAIPNAPDWMTGVIDYQGRVVPVISMRERFSLQAVDVRAETRILIFNVDSDWIAGIVDSVLEVATITQANVEEPPPIFRGLSAEFLKGLVRRDDKLIVLLDVNRVLSTTEKLTLAEAMEGVGENA